MGADGGTKAVIRQFFRGAKGANIDKEIEKVDENQKKLDRATHCAYSSKVLEPPVVACRHGFLYNKEDIIKSLLRKDVPQAFSHIRKLKHLINAKVELNPGFPGSSPIKFICPVTKLEMNGVNKFGIIKQTGEVLSLKAIREFSDQYEKVSIIELFPSNEIFHSNFKRKSNVKKSKYPLKKLKHEN